MENKELYRELIEQEIVSIEDGKFTKKDGNFIDIVDEHDQDCCEHVYADWDAVKLYEKDLLGKTFKELVIKGIEGAGFLLCFYKDWEKSVKIFVPCYNEQNGYYSSDLSLIINGKKIDISSFVEDNIY
jgi:hypothetical protein